MPLTDANDPLTNAITTAMQRGVAQARVMHQALGLPFVIWRDGAVQHVDPVTLLPVAWPSHARDDELPPLPPT